MAIMSAMTVSLSTYYPNSKILDDLDLNIIRLLAKFKTLAAFAYKKSIGQPYVYPRNDLNYVQTSCT
jgi:citrate synthase